MPRSSKNFCTLCGKKYSSSVKYQRHMKIKHDQTNVVEKVSLNEYQITCVQDKIYSLLGDLTQLFSTQGKADQQDVPQEQQKISWQTNYCTNAIIRTPYEPQISATQEIPKQYEFHPKIQVNLTKEQIKYLEDVIGDDVIRLQKSLNEQRNYWQFADPFDSDIDFANEFSVFNIPKLLKNYPKRQLKLRVPNVSIFLVWIARVCKPEMFKLIYQMIVSYEICFFGQLQEAEKLNKQLQKTEKNWNQFTKKQKEKVTQNIVIKQEDKNQQIKGIQYIKGFGIKFNYFPISLQKLKKLLQLYQKWVEAAIPLFCNSNQPMRNIKSQQI